MVIQKPQKMKSIMDLVFKKGIIDIRQMLESDWMADAMFFQLITGIDVGFFKRYMSNEQDFELVNVHGLSSGVRKRNV